LSHLAATWVIEATPSYKYGNKESFEFKFAGEITKDNTWVIQGDSGEDMMVKALECACLAIENIHEEEKFVNIMNLIYG
jgi:hypothetical protein